MHRMLDPRSDLNLALSDHQTARIAGKKFRCSIVEVFDEQLDVAGVDIAFNFVGRRLTDTTASLRDEDGVDHTVATGATVTVDRGFGDATVEYSVVLFEPKAPGLMGLRLRAV